MRDDLPRITVGQGPPLVVLLFTPRAANPAGLARWSAMRMLKPFTERFTVHLLNRPPGLAPGTTMAELVTPSPLARGLLSALLWLPDGSAGHSDAATMLDAEDGFDLRGRLADIKAPTLLVHGEKDVVYPLELARQTAAGISAMTASLCRRNTSMACSGSPNRPPKVSSQISCCARARRLASEG